MDEKCKNCKHFTPSIPDAMRKMFGDHYDGICNLYFPRGYLGRKPPHPARSVGGCFQWEEKQEDTQTTLFEE